MSNSKRSIQEFNERNSIYFLLYLHILQYLDSFDGVKVEHISRNHIRKYISLEGILLNGSKVTLPTIKIYNNDLIEVPDFKIAFNCRQNPNFDENQELKRLGVLRPKNPVKIVQSQVESSMPTPVVEATGEISETLEDLLDAPPTVNVEELNSEIIGYLNKYLRVNSISEIPPSEAKDAFCYIIRLFQIRGFEIIKNSEYSFELTNFVKKKLSDTKIILELNIPKKNMNFDGKIIDLLIAGKAETENNLNLINQNLLNHYYDSSLFKYLQDYRKLYSLDSFQYLINPLLSNKISSPLAIENLLKLVNNAANIKELEDKFIHYENSKTIFVSYFELLNGCDDYNSSFFRGIAEYLFNQLKINCNTAEEKSAQINVESTNRKYNFANIERGNQEIFLIVINEGAGLAKNIVVSSSSSHFEFVPINVGLLKPMERREVMTSATIKFDSNFQPQLALTYQWEEVSGKSSSASCVVEFQLQKAEVPWEELKRQNPYSNSIIEDVEKLFGRGEIIEELKSNILSDNMESYKLWGQKRVGKSSIVKTLKSILDEEEKVILIYRSLGGLKNTDPIITLNNLGESLCSEIYEEVDRKIKSPPIRERLRSIEVPTFNGSLFPLEKYIKELKRIDSSLKFVFILDEFDRINEEFFLPGNLGETLSLSIGKGLNENKFIAFILVGSENMHLLDRQGINYNSYQEKEVDTFDREREYKSFAQIVKGPVKPYINYSDEAVEKIFFESNGNPYFANLICSNIFRSAYKFKDTEINTRSVSEAVAIIINSSQKSHFEHYWSDGITEESNIKKERKADIRRRVLVSFSMSYNLTENSFPNKSEVTRNFKYPLEAEYRVEKYEVDNTITEFYNRKIFYEDKLNQVRILPHLFESWLCGKGKTLMIEGVSDLEALQREIDLENELALKTDELNRLSDNYHFKGNKLPIKKFTDFFEQFGGASEQRRIFKLIDSLYFISKEEVVDFFRKESRNIFTKTEIFLKEKVKTIFREGVELYTFSKYFSENILITESFKLMNHIRQQKLLKSIKSDSKAWKENNSNEIIIIEPIIEDFNEIQEELFLLLTDEIKNSNISIRIVTFIITTKAKADLITATSSFGNLKVISCREVEETKIKPFIDGTEIFENIDESNQAYYEVRKHFPNSDKNVLLVLFEDYCPSKSCPVLWFQSAQFKPLFHNHFGKLAETINEVKENEERRTRLYHANVEISQCMNKFIINHLKSKAVQQGWDNWFNVNFIPKNIMLSVNTKYIADNQKAPLETYFDFSDYKRIIETNNELVEYFKHPADGVIWLDKLNELRRDPSHPEKPAPTEKEVEYFEKMKNFILLKLR